MHPQNLCYMALCVSYHYDLSNEQDVVHYLDNHYTTLPNWRIQIPSERRFHWTRPILFLSET